MLSQARVLSLAHEGVYNLIPLYRDLSADLETPVSAFLKARELSTDGNCFLLESVEGGEVQARYSFIGTHPYRVLRQNGDDPWKAVEAELSGFSVLPIPELPEFTGGAVGYVGYDCVKYFEPKVQIPDRDTLDLPESIFMLCSSLIVFDHIKHTLKVIAHVRLDRADGDEQVVHEYERALQRIQHVCDLLQQPLAQESPVASLTAEELAEVLAQQTSGSPAGGASAVPNSDVGQAGYESFVEELRDNIRQGELIQAVPSQRMTYQLKHVGAFDIYRQLRVINPSPYMFYFDFGDFEIVGASPEQLVKVEQNGRVTTHPIAGTRKRGKTPEEDEALAEELLSNEKERAEHIMLVDLGRNDVGRIALPGTVKVDSLMHIERYSHVMHIVSHVSGQLRPDLSPYDAFRAVFPAGTVSGAPKVRAMQLVAGLEQKRRNIYAGAVGYVSFGGILDTCIAIRTMVVKDGNAVLQAGGGIVYDSEPTAEYKETIKKMRALACAIEAAESHAVEEIVEAATAKHLVMKNYPLPVTEITDTFGKFGGRYVPETLVGALEDLEKAYLEALNDPTFIEEVRQLQRHYVGRPTAMYYADRLTKHCGGAKIWIKREDLAHTGAHKINNALGQGLLAKRMGKKRVIAETGAGQHGVATATACALLDLECVVYMGEEDVQRQALNVFRMKMLGAKVVSVTSGSQTLKDAVNEAMREWVATVETTFFLIGSAIGPHPFPTIVRDFQCVIGEEVIEQSTSLAGNLPDVAVACVGGGSNAIGLFHPLLDTPVRLVGVEAAGHGVETGLHSATIGGGRPGVLHGTRTYLLQDEDGQVQHTHSISAGLDYPGVGPEHAHLAASGRVQYVSVTDEEAMQGLQDLTRLEGIIPALEPSHAVHYVMQEAAKMSPDQSILLLLSGRGDKDMHTVAKHLNVPLISE